MRPTNDSAVICSALHEPFTVVHSMLALKALDLDGTDGSVSLAVSVQVRNADGSLCVETQLINDSAGHAQNQRN